MGTTPWRSWRPWEVRRSCARLFVPALAGDAPRLVGVGGTAFSGGGLRCALRENFDEQSNTCLRHLKRCMRSMGIITMQPSSYALDQSARTTNADSACRATGGLRSRAASLT